MIKLNRRQFLQSAGVVGSGITTAGLLGPSRVGNAVAGPPESQAQRELSPELALASQSLPAALPSGLNILFVLTDQERYFDRWPILLPGRERLKSAGVSFANHSIASCVCTPSRSVIYTGRHIQHTGMFDNAGFPWQPDLPTSASTIGKVLRALGYYAAYQGKWHLNSAMEHENKEWEVSESFMDLMDEYGFSDFIGVGDLIGHDRGGYKFDPLTTAAAVRWLRGRGQALNQQGQPWYLAVNLVNPHDVMFFNTDAPGQRVQEGTNSTSINRAIDHAIYRAAWDDVPLPQTWQQPLDGPGRPRAHQLYRDSNAAIVGMIPNEEARWRRFQDYYFNCLRDVDRHLENLLQELDGLGLRDNTIVVFTADHGELGGSHGGLWGKGSTAYQEQNHVPLIVSHPALPGGTTCHAVTSHVDLVPTIVGLTGQDPKAASSLLDGAMGQDLSPLLRAPEAVGLNAIRDGALFSYNMLLYHDPAFLRAGLALWAQKGSMSEADFRARAEALQINLSYRCAIRSVVDGRYRFSRYFSPRQFNTPTTLEDLLALNDLELYDLEADPQESQNLAADLSRNGDLIVAMNDKLNALIEREVGTDDGSFMSSVLNMVPTNLDGRFNI
jgi:arylsulfatase A-like enzyme